MKDSFLTGKRNVTSPNLKAAKAKLKMAKVKRILSLNLQAAKAKLKPVKKNARVVTSAQLRRAKAALKAVARPRPKPRITGYNLRAAKVRLRKVKAPSPRKKTPSPPKKKVVVPSALLKTAKFDKLVEKIWKNAGAVSGANFQNAWSNSRMKAIKVIENRLRANKPAFTPSPPKLMNKLPSPLSPLGPPKAKPKAPSPPKAKPRAKSPNVKLSPSSGRAKVKSNSSGRWVYANLHFSMEELRRMAALRGVNTKGLRSKADFARKIFARV